jgi:hypothetical protein
LIEKIRKLENEHGMITFLFSAKDVEHNNAVVLKEVIESGSSNVAKKSPALKFSAFYKIQNMLFLGLKGTIIFFSIVKIFLYPHSNSF